MLLVTLSNPWTDLRALTRARIALGRAGGSVPTAELIGFSAAHAAARDAVWTELDIQRLEADLAALGLPMLRLASLAHDRATYLRRPDLGRRLDPPSITLLSRAASFDGCDVVLIVGDGLSSIAVQTRARPRRCARGGVPSPWPPPRPPRAGAAGSRRRTGPHRC